MTRHPTLSSAMASLLEGAADQSARNRRGETVDDEQLTLLLEGRADELPAGERARLLRTVAADPELRELVAALGTGRALMAPADGAPLRFPRWVAVGWSIAACLMLMLGTWRVVDPPVSVPAEQGVQSLGVADDVNYWQQLEQSRADRDRLRDWSLLASGVTCLILSVPLVVTFLRRRQNGKNP